MKTFTQLRQPLTELTAFQDPPQVLVLRRKAMRVFPGDQRVATYRNDNLELEVAIPYDPHTFGRRKTSTVGTSMAEGVLDEAGQYTPEQLKIRRERRTLHADVQRNQHAVWQHESKARSEFTDPKSRQKHIQSIAGAKMKHEWSVKHLIAHQEKHGPLSGIDHHMEETVNGEHKGLLEDTCPTCHGAGHTPGQKDVVCPTCHGDPETPKLKAWDDMRKFHQSFGPAKWAVTKQMNALLTGEEVVSEEPMLEATIHSLHKITKTKAPAMVKFKSGASAMVHHETAARIMKLHSMMKKANKRKIEGLVNSSPDGLKKVIEFATVHMKG